MLKPQAERLAEYGIDADSVLLPSKPRDDPEQGAIRDRLLNLLAQLGDSDEPLAEMVRQGLRVPAGGPVGDALTWVFRQGTTGEEMTQVGTQLREQWGAYREQQPGAPVPHWGAQSSLPTIPCPAAGSLAAFLAEHGLGWNEGEVVRLLLDWAVERRPDDLQAAQEHLQILLAKAASSA